jgi:hypothetical protein
MYVFCRCFQQYFSFTVIVNFICEGTWSTLISNRQVTDTHYDLRFYRAQTRILTLEGIKLTKFVIITIKGYDPNAEDYMSIWTSKLITVCNFQKSSEGVKGTKWHVDIFCVVITFIPIRIYRPGNRQPLIVSEFLDKLYALRT